MAVDRVVDVQRLRLVVGRVRVHALVDRGGEGEGLEGRAGLAFALGGEVVLVVVVRGRRDHRLDVAGLRIDRDERARGAAGVEVGGKRGEAGFLHRGLDRRVDLESAAADGVHAVLLDQFGFDVVEEERLLAVEEAFDRVELETRLLGESARASVM